MSVVIKGSEPFDIMIASNIANCQTANIKFKNISFRCETIEDADGTVFVKMPSAQPEHNPDDERKIADLHKMVNYLLSRLEQQWIPCSERLPEESDGTVLVCFPDEFPYNNKEPYVNAKHNQRVRIASYSQFSNMWYIDDFNAISEIRPIAWMPRPKPYKGGDTE